MKQETWLALLLVLSLGLSACGTGSDLAKTMDTGPQTTVTENADKSITTTYAPGVYPEVLSLQLQADCRNWKQEQTEADRIERKGILELSLKDKASDIKMGFYAMMTMHGDTMDYLKSRDRKFKEEDICKPGTNRWDAYIAEVEENGRTFRQYSSDGFSFMDTSIKWVAGAFTVTEIVKNVGGTTVGGDYTSSGRDTQKDTSQSSFAGTEDHQSQVTTGADLNPTLDKDQSTTNPTEVIVVPAEGETE